MDRQRMREMCRRDQWRMDQLDWTGKPRALSPSDERAIVQLFTDMAGIEMLAAALFEEQARRAKDPVLRDIFESFVEDEHRHSEVAARLAQFYDVHHYQEYRMNPALVRFTPHFVAGVKFLTDDIANSYITAGELILDVALLRSINDYVRDDMSAQAMELINRDESRHIAVDYHMVEYYASAAYREEIARRPSQGLMHRIRAVWALGHVLYYAAPFFRDVFFRPMDLVDASGRRMKEAFKRMQLLGEKPGMNELPFTAFMRSMHVVYNTPVVGSLLAPVLSRITGLDRRYLRVLYNEEELERSRAMSFDQLAQEALAAKFAA